MRCEACERIAHYMANDPEFYRGEEAICDAHRRIRELEEENKQLKEKLNERMVDNSNSNL